MVAIIFKKTPRKSTRSRENHLRRRRKRVAASIKSFYTCRGRLFAFFSKLACISGTHKKIPRKRGNHVPEKVSEIPGTDLRRPMRNDGKALPPLLNDKNTVFLDLDETLIHSRPVPSPAKYDFIVPATFSGEPVEIFVLKRPFLDEFLESLSKKFEIVVFTAGNANYASPILDMLDEKALISHRLYRDSCKKVGERYVKDLSGLGRDMKRVVIVDDNPKAYALQPENAIPIRSFNNDVDDSELKRLIEFFDGCDGVEDVRVAVKEFLAKDKFKEVKV